MTNQEAIASLRTLCHTCKLFPKCAYKKPECFKAIEMAISALKAQDLQPTCNQLATDCISRQEAIDAVDELLQIATHEEKHKLSMLRRVLKDVLPSVQLEITKGDLIKAIQAGIDTMQKNNVYECGMRNGMRWCKALLGEKLDFEDPLQYCKQEGEIDALDRC